MNTTSDRAVEFDSAWVRARSTGCWPEDAPRWSSSVALRIQYGSPVSMNRQTAAASVRSPSGRARNSAGVLRESNIPEPSRCQGLVHFPVFIQHLGAILGRDRNGLRGDPLTVTASLAVHGGA